MTATDHKARKRVERAAAPSGGEGAGTSPRLAAWGARSACAASLALTGLGLLIVALSR
jgi:hypothetical protein